MGRGITESSSMVRDEEFCKLLRSLPCAECGYEARGKIRRYDEKNERYVQTDASNAVHHVGDGVHTRRYSDYYAVPLCDYHNDRKSNNCHHDVAHKNTKETDKRYRPLIKKYWKVYELLGGKVQP